jgi:predicted nucleotidyltransferase
VGKQVSQIKDSRICAVPATLFHHGFPAIFSLVNRRTVQQVSNCDRMDRARRAATHLYAHGASRVWLFGSLAIGRPQDERSDIDLAVEGLPPDRYYRLLSELDQLVQCPVDLVEWETASPILRQQIERCRRFLPPHED